ncbi:MAG: hypothetical protein LKE91_03465 [Lachnospiraceae bacterium]|nr:hypothetical protein [Lachnospiraceae bacterium]
MKQLERTHTRNPRHRYSAAAGAAVAGYATKSWTSPEAADDEWDGTGPADA